MPDNQEQKPEADASVIPEAGAMTPVATTVNVPLKATNDNVSGQWQEFLKDEGMKVDATGNAVPAATTEPPVQPAPTPAPQAEAPAVPAPTVETPAVTPPTAEGQPPAQGQAPEVPAKFQDANGGLDEAKLEKSTVSIEARLAQYREKEKELTQKAQKASEKTPDSPPPQQQAQVTPAQTAMTLDQVTPQMIEESIAKNGQGNVIMELMQMARSEGVAQATQQVQGTVAGLQGRIESRERAEELTAIAKDDPWVFTDEGMKTLVSIRQSKPWLNEAPEPWKEAYRDYKATQALGQSTVARLNPQVSTSTPQAQAGRVPPTPAGAAGSIPQQVVPVNLNDPAAVKKHLDSLPWAEQLKFFGTAMPGLDKVPPL